MNIRSSSYNTSCLNEYNNKKFILEYNYLDTSIGLALATVVHFVLWTALTSMSFHKSRMNILFCPALAAPASHRQMDGIPSS